MNPPNFSFMMRCGQLRHIQATFETAELKNPDSAVGAFLSPLQLGIASVSGRVALPRLRTNPFYPYLVARTRYYDEVFLDAIYDGVGAILNIGCGVDTRAYRFSHVLKAKGVRVVECDQRDAIVAKAAIAKRAFATDHVEYLPVDLNDASWPELEQWLARNEGVKALVMMEGVSPYVNSASLDRFLDVLRVKLAVGSSIAYDYKLAGVDEGFGKNARTHDPFRLSSSKDEIRTFHANRGYALDHVESSAELSARLLPGTRAPVFTDDGLVRLTLASTRDAVLEHSGTVETARLAERAAREA